MSCPLCPAHYFVTMHSIIPVPTMQIVLSVNTWRFQYIAADPNIPLEFISKENNHSHSKPRATLPTEECGNKMLLSCFQDEELCLMESLINPVETTSSSRVQMN